MSNQSTTHAESDSGTCSTVEVISKNLSQTTITANGGIAGALSESILKATGITTGFRFVSTEHKKRFPQFEHNPFRMQVDYIIYCYSDKTNPDSGENKECLLRQISIAAVLVVTGPELINDVMNAHESVDSFYSARPRLASYADRIHKAILEKLSAAA